MDGAMTGKIASTLLSYRPRFASTCWRACWMSRLRALATRTTVGRSIASSSRYIGEIVEGFSERDADGCVAGATDGCGAGLDCDAQPAPIENSTTVTTYDGKFLPMIVFLYQKPAKLLCFTPSPSGRGLG